MPVTTPTTDFELVFNALDTPHMVLNPELVVVAANNALCRALGHTGPALIGRHVHDAFPPAPGPAGQQLAAPWLPPIQQALHQLTEQPIRPQRYDVPCPNGRHEVRYWQGSVRPLLTADGSLQYLLVQLEDATYHQHSGHPLQSHAAEHPSPEQPRQERRLLHQLDQLPLHMVVLHGPDHVVEYISTQARPYLSAASLGKPLREAQPHPGPALLQRLGEVFHTGQVRRITGVPVVAEGASATDLRYLSVTLQPLLDAQGATTGVVMAGIDITDQLLSRRTAAAAVAETQRQQEQFHFLTEFLPQLVWTADAVGHHDYFNQRWADYTGYSTETSLATDVWQHLVHPHDWPRWQQRWARSLQTGEYFSLEFRLRSQHGQYRWFLGQALPLRDAAGTVVKWFGTGTDIDDSRHAQQRLEEKDRQLQQILGQVPAHLCTMLGPEHICGFATPGLLDLFGGRLRVGWPVGETLTELREQGLLTIFNRVFHTGFTALEEEYPLDLLTGSGRQTRRYYFDLTVQPLHDEQQHTQGLLFFATDVTERVQARQRSEALAEEMRLHDQRLRLMTEALPIMTFSVLPGGRTEYMSPQWYAHTGVSPAENVDLRWPELVHPDDLPALAHNFQTALTEGRPWRHEFRMRRHDGQYRWFLSQGVPEFNEAGQAVRWYGSNTEIHELRELQERLHAKDQQLQRIMHHLPALVNTMEGPEHRFTFLSTSMQQLLGERGRLGSRMASALPEVAAQGFERILDDVYRTGEPYTAHEQQVDVLNPDTQELETRYFNFSYQLLPPLEGKADTRGVLSFAVDVSEQVRNRQQAAELLAEVHRRDEQFRVMVEALPNIVYIVFPDGSPEYLSPQWFAYTGHATTEPLAKIWTEAVHPDDLQASSVSWQQAQAQQVPWSGELRIRRHDGQYRWHLARTVPYFNAEGQLLRWYGASVDNHEQRQLQEQLQRREAEFRLLAESIPQLVWVVDARSRPTYFNQRWMDYIGYGLTDFREETDYRLIVHPDDLEPCLRTFHAAVQAGEPCRVEYRLRERHTGAYRWFIGQAVPLRDAAGQVVQWFGTCTDIHEQKELTTALAAQNTELRRINQDLDGFVYTASHDLKQPINNMAGIFQELTRSAQFLDPEAPKLTGMFDRALQQIMSTIQDLTDLVQVQKIRQQVPPEIVDLEQLTAEVLVSVREQLQAANATVELHFDAVPVVHFVRPNLQSVLFNLISNAVRYADPHRPPHIRIWTERHDGQVVLSVQDNGLGIDLERYGPQLFQMFRRFHPHVEGSGMGLYLVQRIVHSHGGQLEVHSRVGEGTTFRIRLVR